MVQGLYPANCEAHLTVGVLPHSKHLVQLIGDRLTLRATTISVPNLHNSFAKSLYEAIIYVKIVHG